MEGRVNKPEKLVVLEEYYVKNFDRLCKTRARWVGGIQNAEDAVQEAFARALQYIDGWQYGEFGPWLGTILNHACADFKKADRLQGGVKEALKDVDDEGTKNMDTLQFTSEMVEKVLGSIEQKKEPVRSVLKSYIVLGHSTTDIAQYVDMAPEAMRKAAQRFKEEMVNRYGTDVCR